MIRSESKQDQRFGKALIGLFFVVSLYSASYAAETDASVPASQFAKEVSKEIHKQIDPPSAVPVFRWDFSKAQVVHTYTYEQEGRSKTNLGLFDGKSSDMGQEMSAKGVLLIKSQGDNTAELVLKDMKISIKIDSENNEPKTMEQQMQPIVEQGMNEDSSGSFRNSSRDMKMLFPLPPNTLKVGESVNVPEQATVNAMGSILQVKGRSRITLARYVRIGSRTCAQFDVNTDISELKIPSELKGEYKYSTKGTSVFYFDVESRSFVSGTIALITQFSINAPMPQMKMPENSPVDMPKTANMSAVSDTLIRVKLKE